MALSVKLWQVAPILTTPSSLSSSTLISKLPPTAATNSITPSFWVSSNQWPRGFGQETKTNGGNKEGGLHVPLRGSSVDAEAGNAAEVVSAAPGRALEYQGLGHHMGLMDSGETDAGDALLDSVMKIFTVASSPNYLLPWQNKPQREVTGSGFAIAGRRILTNAHVVADQTYVLVRKHGSPKRYRADVTAVAHDCDLALLRICNHVEDAESTNMSEEGVDPGGDVANDTPSPHPARVTSVEDEFWEGVVPLEFGDVPELQEEVAVVGYPQGGDNISITTGVVSRVEPTQYAHSAAQLLAIQIDAAINPGNSGGPALMSWRQNLLPPSENRSSNQGADDQVAGGVRIETGGDQGLLEAPAKGHKVAGVTFQNLIGAENIGYIIPVPIIRRFLEDASKGNKFFSGFSSLGVLCQPLENSQLRGLLGVPHGATGVVINSVQPLSAAHGVLQKDDIVSAVDGIDIANDGTVRFRNKERLPFDCLIALKGPEDITRITVLRRKTKQSEPAESAQNISAANAEARPGSANSVGSCEEITFDLTLRPIPQLVPTQHFDLPPNFFIFAGLVFVPLTQPYLHEYGPDWYNASPRRLCERALKGVPRVKGQEVVILSRVLTDHVNSGFERLSELEVKKVNGVEVNCLREVRDAVRRCTDEYVRFDLDDERVVVMGVEQGKKASPRVLRRYRVPRGVSEDLLKGDEGGDKGECEWWEESGSLESSQVELRRTEDGTS